MKKVLLLVIVLVLLFIIWLLLPTSPERIVANQSVAKIELSSIRDTSVAYLSENGNYTNFCNVVEDGRNRGSLSEETSETIKEALDLVQKRTGNKDDKIVCNSTQNEWVALFELEGENPTWWCTDSLGTSREYTEISGIIPIDQQRIGRKYRFATTNLTACPQ
ncbi:MAG: hypothetical protein OXU73_00645 [Candidatus Campbellbacteria bacterium]|nr:hypothetical protein [Candidatus Campbellbacteria bacterium]